MLIEVCRTIIRLEVIGKVSFKMVYRKNGSFTHNFYVFSLFLPNVLCCMIHLVVGWPSSRLKTLHLWIFWNVSTVNEWETELEL